MDLGKIFVRDKDRRKDASRLCLRCRLCFEVHFSKSKLQRFRLMLPRLTDSITEYRRLVSYVNVNDHVPGLSMPYGTIAQISARTNCPYCQFMVKIIAMSPRKERVEYEDTAEFTLSSYREPRFSLNGPDNETIRFELKQEMLQTRVEPPDEIQDADVISIPKIKKMLQDCDATDNQLCDVDGKVHQPFKLRLIDVRRRCLVEADTNCRYIILSYVWGKDANFLRTTKSNLPCLLQDGSLSRLAGVPALVDDSIELVKAIGEDYLWADALCLVQDDAESKYAGIRHMHLIFSQAYLTIVAASAQSAHSSLPGLRRGTRAPATSEPVRGTMLKRRMNNEDLGVGSSESVYNSRGWTMQEFMLSSRCLIFTDQLVGLRSSLELNGEPDYVPRHASTLISNDAFLFYRDFENERKRKQNLCNTHDRGASPFTPDSTDAYFKFLVYANLVMIYSKRQLSYESDILNAFRALQDALANDHKTEFAFGIPLATMGMALLWIPCSPSATRRATSEVTSSGLTRAIFPSWSWVGWKTAVQWEYPIHTLGSYARNQGKYKFQELIPTSKTVIIETEESNGGMTRLHKQTAEPERPILYASLGLLQFTAESVKVTSFDYRPVKYGLIRTALEVLPAAPTGIKGDEKQIGGPKLTFYRVLAYDEKVLRVPGEMDDGKGRGLLWGVGLEEIQNGTDLELVALSSFVPYPDEQGHFPIPLYHYNDSCKDLKELPFVNCLVIRWYGEVAERIGVAQIGSLPWQDAKPTIKAITLR